MPARLGLHFVSPAALRPAGCPAAGRDERRLVPVKDTSGLSRASLPENAARPAIEVDARVSAAAENRWPGVFGQLTVVAVGGRLRVRPERMGNRTPG